MEHINESIERFSIEELLDELAARSDAMVVLILRDHGKDATMQSRYHGGYFTCVGMLEVFRKEHMDGYKEFGKPRTEF